MSPVNRLAWLHGTPPACQPRLSRSQAETSTHRLGLRSARWAITLTGGTGTNVVGLTSLVPVGTFALAWAARFSAPVRVRVEAPSAVSWTGRKSSEGEPEASSRFRRLERAAFSFLKSRVWVCCQAGRRWVCSHWQRVSRERSPMTHPPGSGETLLWLPR